VRRKKVLCDPAKAQSRIRLTGHAMGYRMAINIQTSLACTHANAIVSFTADSLTRRVSESYQME
jgi:hypothetical protein